MMAAGDASRPTFAAGAPARERPVRVMLLLDNLSGNGEARVALNILRGCDPGKVDVRIGLLRRTGALLEELEADRVVAPAAVHGWLRSRLGSPLTIRRMLKEKSVDVVMSFGMGVDIYCWMALKLMGGRRPRWVCREDNNPAAVLDDVMPAPLLRTLVKRLRRAIYPISDALVAVSADLGRQTDRDYRRDSSRTRVIYNPTDIGRAARCSRDAVAGEPKRPYIVAAGRLAEQKGFDILIDAFAGSSATRDLDLVILGEGPWLERLQAQAAALGLGNWVKFPGFQTNPWAWFARAKLFVLSSRWEGFGNVVAEALACRVPVVVSDCDFGPREQVVHGVSGWVVRAGSADDLAAAFDDLLAQPERLELIAEAGYRRALDFDIASVAAQYADLFVELAKAPRRGSRGG